MKLQFDTIIVDTNNLCYKLLSDRQTKYVSQKRVYPELFKSVIQKIAEIRSQYGKADCTLITLYDNSDSRQDLKDSFYNVSRRSIYPEYKVHRKKDNVELYQTLDLIKYYYMVGDSKNFCIQIPNLEADDLVKPILQMYVKPHETALLISNDSDWTRYLSDRVMMLDSLSSEPSTRDDYEAKFGFPISEMNVMIYKSLFGDSADNVPQIITKTKQNVEYFKEFIKKNYVNEKDVIIDARIASADLFKLKEFKELSDLNDKKSQSKFDQFVINMKLVGSFPVDPKHLLAATVMGRNAIKLREAIEKSTGLLSVQKKFSFGLKRPRS